jgi:hypothetical protein
LLSCNIGAHENKNKKYFDTGYEEKFIPDDSDNECTLDLLEDGATGHQFTACNFGFMLLHIREYPKLLVCFVLAAYNYR